MKQDIKLIEIDIPTIRLLNIEHFYIKSETKSDGLPPTLLELGRLKNSVVNDNTLKIYFYNPTTDKFEYWCDADSEMGNNFKYYIIDKS